MLYCIDTNAILDFCYRYYPPEIFESIWQKLEPSVIDKQLQLIATHHIHDEVQKKIIVFGYDISIFETFKEQFRLSILEEEHYGATLLETKADIVKVCPAFKSEDKRINKLEADLSNIAAVKKRSGAVLTSEQGENRDIAKPNKSTRLKIPDVCNHYGIECCNWVDLFKYLGIKM